MRTWAQVEAELLAAPAGTRVVVPRSEIGSPEAAGAQRSSGLPVGQTADFRFAPGPSCRSMHVQEHATIYVAHIDEVAPGCSPVQHLFADAPIVAGLGIAGAVVGVYLGRVSGAIVGVGVGALVGVLVHHAANRPRSRA